MTAAVVDVFGFHYYDSTSGGPADWVTPNRKGVRERYQSDIMILLLEGGRFSW
jgi:hypothetical protein